MSRFITGRSILPIVVGLLTSPQSCKKNITGHALSVKHCNTQPDEQRRWSLLKYAPTGSITQPREFHFFDNNLIWCRAGEYKGQLPLDNIGTLEKSKPNELTITYKKQSGSRVNIRLSKDPKRSQDPIAYLDYFRDALLEKCQARSTTIPTEAPSPSIQLLDSQLTLTLPDTESEGRLSLWREIQKQESVK